MVISDVKKTPSLIEGEGVRILILGKTTKETDVCVKSQSKLER
jgi:hypothetical protein